MELVSRWIGQSVSSDDLAVVEAAREHWVEDLHPEEAALVAGVHPSRRATFAAGRHCARAALRALGARDGPLGRRPAGDPEWPVGHVGSISHTVTHCAAVVARQTAVIAVGVDLEAPSRMHAGILDRICVEPEREALRAIGDDPVVGTLHFAAKEALYKAHSPCTGHSLGFRDAIVERIDHERFEIALLDKGAPRLAGLDRWQGVYACAGDVLAALLVVEP